jgi:hypothetical protein
MTLLAALLTSGGAVAAAWISVKYGRNSRNDGPGRSDKDDGRRDDDQDDKTKP